MSADPLGRPSTAQDDLATAMAEGRVVADRDLSAIAWDDLPSQPLLLERCFIGAVGLGGADLTDARMAHCQFRGTRFAGAVLADSRWDDCSLFYPDAGTGCDFSRADLEGARFVRTNLSMCRFANARLFGAEFAACKAQGADFEEAAFAKAIGGRVRMSRVTFLDTVLDLSNFAGCVLEDCILTRCSLRQADLRRAQLVGTDCRDSDFSEVNLKGAVLDGADLRGATLYGIDITSVVSFAGIKVSTGQLPDLVTPLGVRVFPDG